MARAPSGGAPLSGRRVDAVVFDLFGTLVPEYRRDEFYATVDAIAMRLGADVERFRQTWNVSAPARQTGGWRSMEDGIRELCRVIGHPEPDDAEVAQALAPRAEMYARKFRPQAGAVETLDELTKRGYPIALVSMCAPDTPAMWRASPMAAFVGVTVFSTETGLRKPDPAIYLAAADALDVAPERCLYCGDGAYGELSGAEAVGMTAYLIRDAELSPADALRPDAEEWPGPAIDDLRDLLGLLPER